MPAEARDDESKIKRAARSTGGIASNHMMSIENAAWLVSFVGLVLWFAGSGGIEVVGIAIAGIALVVGMVSNARSA